MPDIKNSLIKMLVKLLQRKKQGQEGQFLIVSTTGLGDTLWATPALKALRQKHPKAYIAVLTSKMGKEVLNLNPHIDELFVIGRSFISLLKQFHFLKKKKFHTIFIFHTSQRAILPLCALLGANEIIGSDKMHKGLDDLLTQKIPSSYQHEVERRIQIANVEEKNPRLEFFVDQKVEHEINSFLESCKISSTTPLLGIHPGAKDKFKQWDPLCFIKVGNMLSKHLGCKIFITGNHEEKKLAEEIASQIEGAVSLAGKFGLAHTASLISRFSAFLANDTGPMHLSFAMDTPTIALFTPTDPKLCGPLPSAKAIVIERHKTCAPCLRKKCLEPFCLLQISPQEVFEATKRLLNG